jgi:hypothetical protein
MTYACFKWKTFFLHARVSKLNISSKRIEKYQLLEKISVFIEHESLLSSQKFAVGSFPL